MKIQKENYFTSIPLNRRNSYLKELSEKYKALYQSLEEKLENSPDDSMPML